MITINDLTPEKQQLADKITVEAERQLSELYETPESKEAIARAGTDDRPGKIILAKQFSTIRETLNRDVEDLLREITPKLGICNEDNPIYQKWEDACEVAKAPLSAWLVALIGTVFPATVPPVALASIVVIISFYGLDAFCDRYNQSDES